MSYVDLHHHLLPGLDDGSRTLDAAVAYARRLDAEGVRDVACTPHVKRVDFPRRLGELAPRRRALQAALDAEAVRVRLHPGGELAHEDALELSRPELSLIAQGPPGGRWLLLECPFAGMDAAFELAAERLAALGYGLLFAHPERAAGGHERLPDDARLQVNVSSLLGRHGPDAQAFAERLVRAGRVFCLASDAHPGTREDTLPAGDVALRELGVGDLDAFRLTRGNARELLLRGVPALQRRAA